MLIGVEDTGACFEVPGQGSDAVLAFCNYGLAADVETLVMQGSDDFQGYGSNQANTIYGNTGNNLINGGGGADLMVGGAGNDTYFIDDAGDLVFENAGEGTDAIFATVSYTLSANVETLVLQRNDEKRFFCATRCGFGQSLQQKYILTLWMESSKLQELAQLIQYEKETLSL